MTSQKRQRKGLRGGPECHNKDGRVEVVHFLDYVESANCENCTYGLKCANEKTEADNPDR